LLGAEQERWLAESWSLQQPWNLLAQQTLMARLSHTPPSDGAGRYWTDGWDGYAASRTRLLQTVVDRQVPGVVVLGGDVHGNYCADLRVDFDKPSSPIVASEFCGTSITSDGGKQELLDKWLPHNPHIHHGRLDQHGTMRFKLDAKRLDVELRVVDDIRDPKSAVRAAQRFSVEAARPGVLKS
jgi:alkaline phosphatase D